MKDALDELRDELGDSRIDFAELVALGAHAKAAELRRQRPSAKAARARLAERIRDRSIGMDVAAADEVKRAGLLER